MNLKEALEDLKIKENGPSCEGLLFRGFSNFYYQDGTLCRKEGVRLLKRKSCKGWEECKTNVGEDSNIMCDHWMLDEMQEMLSDWVILPEIEDGALYRLRMTNQTYDYESGYCDGFDFEFYKVEEDG